MAALQVCCSLMIKVLNNSKVEINNTETPLNATPIKVRHFCRIQWSFSVLLRMMYHIPFLFRRLFRKEKEEKLFGDFGAPVVIDGNVSDKNVEFLLLI
jgi:hypothetical protein